MSEELAHDHVGVGTDEVHVAPIEAVLQPVVLRRAVVTLELARRGVAKDQNLEGIRGKITGKSSKLKKVRRWEGRDKSFPFISG